MQQNIQAHNEIQNVIHLQHDATAISIRGGKIQKPITIPQSPRNPRTSRDIPFPGFFIPIVDQLPPRLRLRQILTVVSQPKLCDLRRVIIPLTLPLCGHRNPLDCTHAFHPLPNLHVVIFKVHEDSTWVVLPFRMVNLAVAVRPFEPLQTVVRRQFPVHFEIFVEESEGQIDLIAFLSTGDGVIAVYHTIDLLRSLVVGAFVLVEMVAPGPLFAHVATPHPQGESYEEDGYAEAEERHFDVETHHDEEEWRALDSN